ncbi:unnamed protein product [Triticum turgidum subsp. durum]|uniref:RNA helicase n=1 Tax=Triticum turgidum subsp. durum TaxID=4567 RepID=A0A9R0YPV4_TRITD|nr:unnamed protein product [Triticum turgidum subsp. durum]
MRLIIGQVHRNVLALASSRSCFVIGDHLPFRMLSLPRASGFHQTAWRGSQTVQDSGSTLTLASLEVQSKADYVKKERMPQSKADYVKKERVPESKADYVKKERGPRTGGPKPNSRDSAFSVKPKKVSSLDLKPAKSALPKSPVVKKKLKIDEALFSASSFEELGLPPLLIDRLNKEGLTSPTEVQSASIPVISQRHDAVIQSYTGSGKTLAYLLPILSEIGPLKRAREQGNSEKRSGIEAVVVAPSRELGMQIVREVEKILGPDDKRLVQQLVGGANRSRQEEALKKNKPIIVVGTPGRISEISAAATVPFSVIRAARSWGHDPVLVRAKSVVPLDSITVPRPMLSQGDPNSDSPTMSVNQAAVDSLPPSLEHYYCTTKAHHKVDTVRRCIHALEAETVIAFMNNTKPLKDVVFKLEARGMKAIELHGDLGKLARSTVLKKFKAGEFRVLVTNELSARGLDIPECDLVINLDLPTDSTHYAHRAGRTGRLGRKGTVVSICEESEAFIMRKMRKQLGVAIKPCEFTEGQITVHKEEDVE